MNSLAEKLGVLPDPNRFDAEFHRVFSQSPFLVSRFYLNGDKTAIAKKQIYATQTYRRSLFEAEKGATK